MVKSCHISFGLPCIIDHGNNVYGPYQHRKKFMPRFIMLLNAGNKMTIQSNGSNKRTFIHAIDVARAFFAIINHGFTGDVYNIGSRDEKSVLDIVRMTVVKYVRAHMNGERQPAGRPNCFLHLFCKDLSVHVCVSGVKYDELFFVPCGV
ncbi:GDP-mannose 4,6 dehydratase [Trypanosoma cruzi]|nr:GDP-mannose 4,6 dehydratase [Trypanosoma cruzi]